MRYAILLAVLAAPVFADTCPPGPDRSAALSDLRAALQAAPDAGAAGPISAQMWELWLSAPDAVAQELLDEGLRKRNNFDFFGAFQSFDALIAYCPDYAEGFNQRAFTSYLREDFAAALVDLDAALALLPDHVGAQSGRALTLMNLGRIPEARAQMLAALDNNPWLSERALLADGGPLAVPGEDI